MAIRENLQKSIIEFLECKDNSRMMTGKTDTKKRGTKKVQKRILRNYLYNPRLKYLAETLRARVSQLTFYRMQPAYMQLACFASCDTCVKHHNMALFLPSIKNRKLISNVNPNALIKKENNQEVVDNLRAIPHRK